MLLLESQQSLFEFENNHQSSTKQDSLTDMAATENCTDQSPNQWLRLTKRHLLPSVDIGTDCLPLFSGLIRMIPLYDFVVLPNWEFYPSSLPLSVSLCCPVQSFFFIFRQLCFTKRQHQNNSKPDFHCTINLK